jgi:hypothetical protein
MKKMVLVLVACAAVAASADLAERYFRGVRKVVSTDTATIPGSVITRYRQGSQEWATTNVLRRINSRPVVRYSKLKLIEAAKAAGKWADVKAFIQAHDMMDEWNACQYITSDYPAFITATNAVVSAGIATSDQIAVFLKLAED